MHIASLYSGDITISISIEPPRQAEVEALLAAGTAFAHSLYPEENSFLLYRGRGYEQIELFGQYVGEESSVCFAKSL